MKNTRFKVYIDDHIAERAKRAVYWTPGMTLSRLAENALLEKVDAMEKQRKAPFPPYKPGPE
jgi:hypothetical protein